MGGGAENPGRAGLTPRYLLDTHVLIRWLTAPKKLSREQARVLREAVRRRESVAISAISLLEIAILFGKGSARSDLSLADLFAQLDADPAFEILPLTLDVAAEMAALDGSLRDPADRAIVCTARVRKLRLITSDHRIIESKLIPVVV